MNRLLQPMVALIDRFIAPPRVPDREDQFAVSLLNSILLASLAGAVVIVAALFILSPEYETRVWAMVPIPLLLLGLVRLMHAGRLQLARQLTAWLIWVMIAVAAFTGGGVGAPAFTLFIIPVLMASFLLGRRYGVGMALLSALAGLAMVLAELAGLLGPTVRYGPVATWLLYAITFLMGALILHLANRSIERAMNRVHQSETTLLAQNQQLARQATELKRANRAYRVLSECNQAVVRASDEAILLPQVCQILVEQGGYRMAWIGFAGHDPERTVIPAAQAGDDTGYLAQVHISWADDASGRGPTGTAIRTGRPAVNQNMQANPAFRPWREPARQRGLAASIALPLLADGVAFGALNIYATEPDAFDAAEQQLLMELAHDVAFGVRALRTRAEQAQQEAALRESEALFRTLFENAPLGLGLADDEGNLVAYNRAMLQPGGYSQEDIARVQNVAALYYNEEERAEVLAQARQQGYLDRAGVQFRRRDGTPYDVLLSLRPVQVGREPHWQAMVEDITVRRQAEARLRFQAQLLHSVRESVISTDLEGRIVYWGNGAEALYGYAEEEVLGKSVTLIVAPEEEEEERARMAQVMATGRWRGQYWQQRRDGSRFFADTVISLVKNEQGEPVGLIGIDRDITKGRETEVSLHRSLDETAHGQRLLLALSQVGQTALRASTAVRIYGTIAAEVAGLGYHAVILEVAGDGQHLQYAHSTFAPEVVAMAESFLGLTRDAFRIPLAPGPAFRRLVEERTTTFSEQADAYLAEVFPRPEAQQILPALGVQQTIGAPIVVGDRLRGLLFVIGSALRQADVAAVDILAHQMGVALENARLYGAVRRHAAQLQQILDAVPEGILLLDDHLSVQLANPTGRRQLQALTVSDWEQPLTHLGSTPLPALLEGADADPIWHEVSLTAPRRVFEVAVRPVETGSRSAGWVLILREVTEDRERQGYQRAQERLATVGQLAAGVAHDFNNILAVIQLYAELMSGNPELSPKDQERVEIIQRQAGRAASLIGQILDFSRRSVMERASFRFLPFLKELLNLMERTLPENITIQFQCGQGQFVINADPARLQQVLMNLALNARDAMPAGGELRIALSERRIGSRQKLPLPDMSPGHWLQLTVSDTGAGIEERLLPHIFEPFFTTKSPGQGTGLGLAQAYGIIRQHEGYIDVVSQVNEGTTFTIFLPAVALVETAVSERPTGDPLSPRGQGQTILIVENDVETRAAVRDTLALLNYHTLEAGSGQEALALYERHAAELDLVLSDLVMPGMGGEALFHALRERDPALRMVMMTGYPIEEAGRALLQQGLVAWISKPFHARTIAEVIDNALRES